MKAREHVAENLSRKFVKWFDEIRFALARTGLCDDFDDQSLSHRRIVQSERKFGASYQNACIP